MKSRQFTKALAILLTTAFIAPSVFLVVPQPIYAQSMPAAEVPTGDWITRLKETLNLISTYTNTAANYAGYVNTYVLQPLAFVLSGNLMKMLTGGVIAFVIGKANGTGVPQFAVDVMQTMQTVGDSQALAYLNGFGRNSNSPFASSISSALRTNYLSNTSLAGFWAANMNTLARSSPNVPAFLAGNWSQGGVAAWFALTTQVQNNPYTFYQASQSQMGSLVGTGVGGATGARLAQLSWGQGFMSWCGAADPSTSSALGTSYNSSQSANAAYGDAYDAAAAEPGNQALQDAAAAAKAAADAANAKTTSAINSTSGINPGDPCSNKDGTPGQIKTPGSTIKATLDKVLGGQQDQITRMGNIGPQINQILGNIATVMQTVNFAADILGNASLSGATGGLLGADEPSSSNTSSRLAQFTPVQTSSGNFTSGYVGVTNSSVYENASAAGPSPDVDLQQRITDYQAAWNTITTATKTASTSVQALISYCNSQLAQPDVSPATINAQVSAAQAALTNIVAPVFAKASAAGATIAFAQRAITQAQSELATSNTPGSTYFADLQKLRTMAPTDIDVVNAQSDAQIFIGANASPAGSLTISGGSLLNQMSLVSSNATALKAVCDPSASAAVDETGSSTGD